jgi:hypothetical protein
MSIDRSSIRWRRHGLIEQGKQVLRLAGGIGFIAFGIVVAVVRNVQYVEKNDIRASDGYHFASGAIEIAIGILAAPVRALPKVAGSWAQAGRIVRVHRAQSGLRFWACAPV